MIMPRASLVIWVAKILSLADEGAEIYITAIDPDRWARIKALVPGARIRLAGRYEGICESFQATLGDFMINARGPSWVPSLADLHRLIEERTEG
jgi:hypothetical protein